MKARRLSFVLSLPLLALGLPGCAEDDGTGPIEREQRDVPTRTDDEGSLRGTEEEDETTTPDDTFQQDESGIPPVPNETGDPMYRERDFEGGAETGPQQTDPDQTEPLGGAND